MPTNSPQALRNSARIHNRNLLGIKRNLIKTNPNSSRVRRNSLGFEKNTAKIALKLTKVKHNLSQMQKILSHSQQSEVNQDNSINISTGSLNSRIVSKNSKKIQQNEPKSSNSDEVFNNSGVNIEDLFPQITLLTNDNPKSVESNLGGSRFSIGNIELPPSLQIRPILGLEASKTTNNSISGKKIATNSTIGLNSGTKSASENVHQLASNLIPPTKFFTKDSLNSITLNPLTTLMSTPQSSIIPALSDPRISSIFTNPNISVAVTSTTNAISSAASSKWSGASNLSKSSEVQTQDSQNEEIPNQKVKMEPMDMLNCDQNNRMEAETSSNHDSLISSENEHQNEWNLFFKSLMHDLTKMDERQRRKFKQKTFVLIDDILQ